ncbi:hypothetical protein KM1_150190 [Entamoeba histolytica HM-3:IMSS]|nr:hypothetical protein KM1_150190 [Entamoeba histolytica HM-3:IMSS]GAT95098.1 hypothetical protein CL6EHI_084710 [Entamoeba histolytica]
MFCFLLLFIVASNAKQYHMCMIMLGAPKEVPMLNYSVEYLLNAYERKPPEIVIDHFYFVKGCNHCPHPEMEMANFELQKHGINSSIANFEPFKWIQPSNIYSFEEMYHSLWSEDQRAYRNFGHHKKDNIVTYYFHQGAQLALKEFNNTDFIMFFEDDQSIHRNSFVFLKQVFDSYGPRTLTKYATPLRATNDGYYDPNVACIWGWWGTLMSNHELKRYLSFIKFNPWTYCGDMLFCDLGRLIDQPFYLRRMARHFGRDKDIMPKDPDYY